MKKFLLLVGKSGAGKDSVASELVARYGVKQLQSYTTRPKRSPEENCHIFVKCLPNEKMVAYTKFNGFEYCATERQVDENDVYIVDPDGVLYFMEQYHGDKDPVVVYLNVGWFTRFVRMMKRGDGFAASAKRIIHDSRKFRGIKKIGNVYYVKNKHISVCVSRIAEIFGLEE